MEAQTPFKKYWFGKRAGVQADGFYEFYKSALKPGELDLKSKELIAVAVSSIMRCKHCVSAHTREALKAGASKEEIAEALMVASFIATATQQFWNEDMEQLLGED